MNKAAKERVLLVTGMSGAGKTSALKALEDLGYEAVDNMPLSLVKNLVASGQQSFAAAGLLRPIAIGIDIRTRDFGVEAFSQQVNSLITRSGIDAKVLFLDCDNDELRRRYATTRHRHPLAQDRPVSDGIEHERRLVGAIRDHADVAIDTSGLGPGDLKRILQGHFRVSDEQNLGVFVTSFSYRQGLPREADLVFDVRFLANPHYDPALKTLTGRDKPVAAFIGNDEGFDGFFERLTAFLQPLLPRYAAEGKSYLTIAVGCTGGQHRSVFVAEKLKAWLDEKGQRVHLHHRDLNRAVEG